MMISKIISIYINYKNTMKKSTMDIQEYSEDDCYLSKIELSDLYADPDYVIPVDEDVVLELLNEFEPTHAWLEQIGCLLMHSPFDKETVEGLLKEWYFQEGTDHHNLDTIDAYLNKYYKREYTNRWLFSIIKKISDTAKRDIWYNEYISKGIDPDIKIDLDDDFSFKDLRKNYNRVDGKGIDAMRFMNDLKRVSVLYEKEDIHADSLIALKCYNCLHDIYKIGYTTEKKFINLLKGYNIGRYYKNGKLKDCSAADVYSYMQNRNCLKCKSLKFYSTDPDDFSYFHGYDYEELDDYNKYIISEYLNHIRNFVANGNEELYNYILNWISYIIQNPDGKTGTCLVLTRNMDDCKDTFTNVICKLLERYSVRSVCKICDLVGNDNEIFIENNKLLIYTKSNYPGCSFRAKLNSLKSLITEDVYVVKKKYMKPRIVQNVVNLIISTNYCEPKKDDNIYVICETNDSHINDYEYFLSLQRTFTEEFYQNLFTYFMKRNLDGVNLRILPNTSVKQALVDANKSTYELFIQDFIIDFKKGFIIEEAYTYYNKWAFINEFIKKDKKVEKTVFCKNVLPFIDKKQIRSKEYGTRKWAYKLKEEKEKYFDLDKYEHIEKYEEFKAKILQ